MTFFILTEYPETYHITSLKDVCAIEPVLPHHHKLKRRVGAKSKNLPKIVLKNF